MRRGTRNRTRSRLIALAVPLLAAGLAVPATAQGAAAPGASASAVKAGVVGLGAAAAGRGTNPYTGLLEDAGKADYASWSAALAERGAARQAARRAPAPLLVDEQEPVPGANDTPANAQRIPAFGTGTGKRPAARILGTVAPPPEAEEIDPPVEDDGAIPLATDTGLDMSGEAVTTSATIGDGPHGSAGDETGDFDVFAVLDVTAGQELVVDVDTPASDLDGVALLYSADGEELAFNDDEARGQFDPLLRFVLPADGDYYVFLAGYSSSGFRPADPFDSGSGSGVGREGDYDVRIGLDVPDDVDVYAVDLQAGDMVGASAGVTSLRVYDPAGNDVIGSTQDFSGIYPASSPLPGGGATLAHVAVRSGWHALEVRAVPGDYDVTLEAYRPGLELRAGGVQTVFLDFNGARVNTAIFGGPGVSTLSPFDAFLGRWGIPTAQRDAVIDRVVATTRENLERDFVGRNVAVRILNSRDHRDTFGAAGVSRIVVGGTIAQSGIPTIGIAQSIDPGNFELEETALVLLDTLSDPASEGDASLNYYLRPSSDRIRFVGTAIGNIVSHEAGHYLGNFHVDQFNDVLNLMDQGGNFPLLYGVGPDGIGGTADDPDVDFGQDVFTPLEGLTGRENTRSTTRWGLSGR